METQVNQTELMLLSKFTTSALEAFINNIKTLNNQNSAYDNELKREIIEGCAEIYTYLPKIKSMYLAQSIGPFTKILQLLTKFIQTYPTHTFNPSFVETINAINNHFRTFQISESLSNSESPQLGNDDEERTLQQRIINPNSTVDQATYDKMIQEMVRSAKSNNASNDNWKALAVGIKNIQECKGDSNSYIDAFSDLMLAGVNRLKQREKEYSVTKQKVAELSLSKEELKRKRREDLLNRVADGLFNGEDVD